MSSEVSNQFEIAGSDDLFFINPFKRLLISICFYRIVEFDTLKNEETYVF